MKSPSAVNLGEDPSTPGSPTGSTTHDHKVEVFYDGECPLCVREIKLLCWLDRKQDIRFTDIAATDFTAADYGKTATQFMDEIHGRLPGKDGEPAQWIIGVEVFRQLYVAVGFGLLVWPSRLPGISHALNFGYHLFAKNRLRLTGRCSKDTCKVS